MWLLMRFTVARVFWEDARLLLEYVLTKVYCYIHCIDTLQLLGYSGMLSGYCCVARPLLSGC